MNASPRRSIMPLYTRRRLLLVKITATNVDNCCTVVNTRSSNTWALPSSFIPWPLFVASSDSVGRRDAKGFGKRQFGGRVRGATRTRTRYEAVARRAYQWRGPRVRTAVMAFRHRNDVAGAYRRRRTVSMRQPWTGGVFTLRRRRRTPLPPLPARRTRQTPRESRDWRHCCWRANAPVRHRGSRRAGVITKYVRGGHQTARPIRFRRGISTPLPPVGDEYRSTPHVRSLARTARPPPTDAPSPSSFARAHTSAEQRRRATATTTTTTPPPRTKYPVRSFVVARVGEGDARRSGGYIAILPLLLLLLLLLFLSQNNPCNMCFSHHQKTRIFLRPNGERRHHTILAQIIL